MALDQFAYRFRDHGNASVALSSTSWGVNQSTPFGAVNPARQTVQGAETLYVQLFQSDEATTLSNEMLVASAYTDSAFVNTAVVNFTGLDTSSGKAVWDGAKIRLRWA